MNNLCHLMIIPGIDPHWFGLTRANESTFAVEIDCASVSDDDVLMKIGITVHKAAHQFPANSTPLILRKYEQVRIINNQVSVRNRVAEADKSLTIPSRHQGMRSKEGFMQQLGFSAADHSLAR